MLLPKKTKFRKMHRGHRRGESTGQTTVHFGEYGIKALEDGWITNRQIEAARIAMTRKIKRGGKVWINKGEIMPEGYGGIPGGGKETRLGDQDTARRRGGVTEGLGASRESGRNRGPDREGLGPVRRGRPGQRGGGNRPGGGGQGNRPGAPRTRGGSGGGGRPRQPREQQQQQQPPQQQQQPETPAVEPAPESQVVEPTPETPTGEEKS